MKATFLDGYIECALWASSDDNDTALDRTDCELAPETLESV